MDISLGVECIFCHPKITRSMSDKLCETQEFAIANFQFGQCMIKVTFIAIFINAAAVSL